MIRILLVLILGVTPAMAKPTGGLLQQSPAAPIDPEKQFWDSEEGRDIERLYDEVTSGRKSMEQATEEYNKKWADKPISGGQSAPAAPLTRVR